MLRKGYFCSVKYIFVFIAVSLLLANSLVKFTQVIHFAANQERIAKELCVERNVENSCCAGKCHLEKTVKAVEKDFSDPVQGAVVVETFDPLYIGLNLLPSSLLNNDQGIPSAFHSSLVEQQFVNQIFHTPIV